MPFQSVTNPMAVYDAVTDYTTGLDTAGAQLPYGKIVFRFRANATIARGHLLEFVAPTATVPMSVQPYVQADVSMFAGVAEKAAVAGDALDVTVLGHTVVLMTSGTALQNITPDATAGQGITSAPTAASIAGMVFGICMAPGAGLKPAWIRAV